MEPRWAQIESRVGDLERSVRTVEDRLARIESLLASTPETIAPPEPEPAPALAVAAAEAPPAPVPLDFVGGLALTGRALLGLAGGYLLRAFTSEDLLPAVVGAVAGLLYAASWLWLADRAAARGRTPAAAFYGATALLLALPLIWETTARFGILSPAAGAAALTAITAFGLAVAWRRELRALAWIVAIGGSSTAVALGGPTGAPVPYGAVAVALGVATLWLARARTWRFLPWATAALADLAVLLLWMEDPIARGQASTAGVLAVQLALFVLYVGSFARAVSREDGSRDDGSSDDAARQPGPWLAALQTVAAVGVGFAGALAVARPAAALAAALGVLGLVLAAASQAAAARASRREDARGLFYFAGLATLLLVTASGALLPQPAVLWAGLAIVLAVVAVRGSQLAFRLQASVLAAAAVAGSGLAVLAVRAWTSAPTVLPALAVSPVVAVIAAAVVCLLAPGGETGPWVRRFDVALQALTLVAAGAVAVVLAAPLFAADDPARLATVRTAVVAAAALALALAAKSRLRTAPLVYPLLLIGAVKLLIEDFPAGEPSTLFVSLALYGGALILAPRRLRAG